MRNPDTSPVVGISVEPKGARADTAMLSLKWLTHKKSPLPRLAGMALEPPRGHAGL